MDDKTAEEWADVFWSNDDDKNYLDTLNALRNEVLAAREMRDANDYCLTEPSDAASVEAYDKIRAENEEMGI